MAVAQQEVVQQVEQLNPKDLTSFSRLSRKWDLVFVLSVIFAVAFATHLSNMLLGGDWDFWTDWKDRQWWPLITPVITILPAAVVQKIAWDALRLPVGATIVVVCLLLAQWAVRLTAWGLWVYMPVNITWPANMVVMGVVLDITLFWTRSYAMTSLVGALAWGVFFQPLHAPMIATFNQPVIWKGTLLSLADVQGYMYPRAQTPVYQRIVEAGHFRAFLQQASFVIAAFSGFVSVGVYWVGYFLAKHWGLLSADNFFPFYGSKKEPAGPALAGTGATPGGQP